MLNQNVVPASVMSELPLKLARKCVDVLGTAAFEDEGLSHTVNTGTDDEIATICAGKEFGLIRTVSGKVNSIFRFQFYLHLRHSSLKEMVLSLWSFLFEFYIFYYN